MDRKTTPVSFETIAVNTGASGAVEVTGAAIGVASTTPDTLDAPTELVAVARN